MASTGGANATRPHLQDGFLDTARREKMPVTIYLMNGFQLKGVVVGFDPFTIALDYEGRTHLVYKHAVSTISPQGPLPFGDGAP